MFDVDFSEFAIGKEGRYYYRLFVVLVMVFIYTDWALCQLTNTLNLVGWLNCIRWVDCIIASVGR